MRRALTAILASGLPVSATAMPPPVPVTPLVLSAPADSKVRAELVELIEAMGKEGHFTLAAIAQGDLAKADCLRASHPDAACLATIAPKRVEGEPEMSVVVDTPEWRMAAVRVRCVGPDVSQAREIQLYLSDARSARPNALQEKAKLAGCMIGALYSAPVERG